MVILMKKQRDINVEIVEMIKSYRLAQKFKDCEGVNAAFIDILDLTTPIIRYCISQMAYKPPITAGELEEVGSIRLWEIIDKYQECETIPFTNYVIRDLKFTMINYIAEEQNRISIPVNVQRTNSKIRNAIADGSGLDEFSDKELETFEATNTLNVMGDIDDHEDVSDVNQDIVLHGFEWSNDELFEIYEGLCEDEKDLLNAIVFEEMSYAEYGRSIGKTRETVRVRYNKLQEKIRRMVNA